MAEERTTYVSIFGGLAFWGFITVKVAGHVFADWSWWWIFIPFVPWFGLLIERFGL